jgi:hypothetical protein
LKGVEGEQLKRLLAKQRKVKLLPVKEWELWRLHLRNRPDQLH